MEHPILAKDLISRTDLIWLLHRTQDSMGRGVGTNYIIFGQGLHSSHCVRNGPLERNGFTQAIVFKGARPSPTDLPTGRQHRKGLEIGYHL